MRVSSWTPARCQRILLLSLFAASALALSACGSSSKNDTTTSTPASAATTAAAASSGDVVEIHAKNILFNPDSVTVKVGQTVKWINDDSIDHTVTAKSGADFDSPLKGGGGTFEFKATKAGTIDYVCTIHTGQSGTITVTQ